MKTIMKAIGMFLIIPFLSQAQSDEDALRYTQLSFGGTARFMGTSGAFGALGADFSTLSFNPAGIGVYRSSEFSFSPSVTSINTDATFEGNTLQGNRAPFNISSFGVVFSQDLTRKDPTNKWKRFNVAFGANRLSDFNSNTNFKGVNPDNSMIDFYVAEANSKGGTNPNSITNTYSFGSGLFYQTYLINPTASDSAQYTGVVNNGNIEQSGYISQEGSNTEYLFSFGGNYDDHLMLGMTVGLPSINYNSYTTFTESDINSVYGDFESFTKTDYLNTNGVGINAKFGLSYIFNQYFRVGAALHTPTYYYMHDNYNLIVNSNLEKGKTWSWSSPDGSYDYHLVTPLRGIFSAAVMFKQHGFIDVDYEIVPYDGMHYNFNRYATSEEISIEQSLNQTINQKYRFTQNVRAGGEYVYDIFRLRAGVAYYGSPYNSGVATGESDYSRLSFSGGAGIREKHGYLDFAYVHTLAKEYYQAYTLTDQSVPGVAIDKVTNNFVATIGYKF